MMPGDSEETNRLGLIALEVLLYLEVTHGRTLSSADVVAILSVAVGETFAQSLKPGADVDAALDWVVAALRDQVHELVRNPPPSPEQILALYQARDKPVM